ncbi:MAG: aspartate/glutamate racemase family protein [Clostridia bacterium]|nr:aspartate/glutamate racemase family protein [Clostridia bacterium]
MIGIFDSGVGGLTAYRELARLLPRADILYLADRKNAPYGTKEKDELISLVRRDIQRLRALGAEKILVACCTASTVCSFIPREEALGVIPIILPTARISAARSEKIAVIATKYTVNSQEFTKQIRSLNERASVTEIEAGRLVSLVESGARDGRLDRAAEEYLDALAEKIAKAGADTLIFGCTHFTHVEGELKSRLPHISTLHPSRIGAAALASLPFVGMGRGKRIYTE